MSYDNVSDRELALRFASHLQPAGVNDLIASARAIYAYLTEGNEKAPAPTPAPKAEAAKPEKLPSSEPSKPLQEKRKPGPPPDFDAKKSQAESDARLAPDELAAVKKLRATASYKALPPEEQGYAEMKTVDGIRAEKEKAADAEALTKPALSADDVKEVIQKLLKANKRKELMSLFEKFKAKSFSSIAESDWNAFYDQGSDILLGS